MNYLKESFYFADPRWLAASGERQHLPHTLEASRDFISAFICRCTEISHQLLVALAKEQKLDPPHLASRHNGEHSRLRLLQYPPVAECNGDQVLGVADIRAGALTDYGSLTLLSQNKVSDLQVQRDGHWLDVPPMNGCIIVNIGDASKILDWRMF